MKQKLNKKKFVRFIIVILVVLLAIIGFVILQKTGNEKNVDSNNTAKAKELSDYYYYEQENEARYESFKKDNPDLEDSDIVWMVNANMDKDFYEDPETIENPEDILSIASKRYILPEDYKPDDLVEIAPYFFAREEAASAFKELKKAAESDSIDFKVQSGFRAYDVQKGLYNDAKYVDPDGADTYSARPGASEHQTGLVIDVNIPNGGELYDFIGTKQAEWLAANAYKYGFIIRYTEENEHLTGYMAEPWHIRYIGKKHAKKMHDEKIQTLEEYRIKYVEHQPE